MTTMKEKSMVGTFIRSFRRECLNGTFTSTIREVARNLYDLGEEFYLNKRRLIDFFKPKLREDYRYFQNVTAIDTKSTIYKLVNEITNEGFIINPKKRVIIIGKMSMKIGKYIKLRIKQLGEEKVKQALLNVGGVIEEDFSWEKWLAQNAGKLFTDNTLVISFNINDFWYSSNRYCSFNSCYAPIGCYSSSNLSLMRDKFTSIAYITDGKYYSKEDTYHKIGRVWIYLFPDEYRFLIGNYYTDQVWNKVLQKSLRYMIYDIFGTDSFKVKYSITPEANVPVRVTYDNGARIIYLDDNFTLCYHKQKGNRSIYLEFEESICPYCGYTTEKLWGLETCCEDVRYPAEEGVEYSVCDWCGAYIYEGDYSYWCGEDLICEECYQEHCFTCERCETVHHVDYMVRIIGKDYNLYYCEYCAEEAISEGDVFQCYECGKYYNKNNFRHYYIEDTNVVMCEECYDEARDREEIGECEECGCILTTYKDKLQEVLHYTDGEFIYYCKECLEDIPTTTVKCYDCGEEYMAQMSSDDIIWRECPRCGGILLRKIAIDGITKDTEGVA